MLLDVVKDEVSNKIWVKTPKEDYPEACKAFLDGTFDGIFDQYLPRDTTFVGLKDDLLIFRKKNSIVVTVKVWEICGGGFRISIRKIGTRKDVILFDDLFWFIGYDGQKGYPLGEVITNCSYALRRAECFTKSTYYWQRLSGDLEIVSSWIRNSRDAGIDDAKKLYSSAQLVLDEDFRFLNGNEAARFGGKPAYPEVLVRN